MFISVPVGVVFGGIFQPLLGPLLHGPVHPKPVEIQSVACMVLHGPHGAARGTVRAFMALKANHAPWDPQQGARAASEGGTPSSL